MFDCWNDLEQTKLLSHFINVALAIGLDLILDIKIDKKGEGSGTLQLTFKLQPYDTMNDISARIKFLGCFI